MIGRLSGTLAEIVDNVAIVDVHGVGYEIEVPSATFDDTLVGGDCTVYVHHVVQQDGDLLYGFPNRGMREFFRVLIKIPSVGPKSALAILSTYSVEQLSRIARERDAGYLTRIKGIGKRGAERIVLELANIVDNLPFAVEDAMEGSSTLTEAENALVSLGYRQGDARRAVEAVWHDGMPIEQLVRLALQRIATGS